MTVLVTGFPGFIGGRLVGALLRDSADVRIACVVEPAMAGRAREQAASLDGDRVELLEGDITARRLGLPDADYERGWPPSSRPSTTWPPSTTSPSRSRSRPA